MKKRNYLLIGALIASLALVGCSEQIDKEPNAEQSATPSAAQNTASSQGQVTAAAPAAASDGSAAHSTGAPTSSTGVAGNGAAGQESDTLAASGLSAPTVIALGLLVVALGLLAVIYGLMRWRRVTDSGMMAFVPVDLLKEIGERIKLGAETNIQITDQALVRVHNYFTQIDEGNKKISQSVQILDGELKAKDKVIEQLLEIQRTKNHLSALKKVARLSNDFGHIEKQLIENKITVSDAFSFLRDELLETAIELGAELYEPKRGDSEKTIQSELCDVERKDEQILVSGPFVVTEVAHSAIFFSAEKGGPKLVLRKARVIVEQIGA